MTNLAGIPQADQYDIGPFIARLHRLSALDGVERSALQTLFQSSEWFEAGACILAEREASQSIAVVLSGMAFRYKDLGAGRRQIVALLLRDDVCGGYSPSPYPIHFGVSALTRVRLARVSSAAFWDLVDRYPAIAKAVRNASLVDEAILRAWLVNLGQRAGKERLAHLLCELEHRIRCSGLLISNDQFELPLSQQELGSILGMTSVHVNRVLQRLRADQLLAFHSRLVRIKDLKRLHAVAEFDCAYLDLPCGGPPTDAPP